MSKGFLFYELLVALFLFIVWVVVVTHFFSYLVSVHSFIEKRACLGLTLYQIDWDKSGEQGLPSFLVEVSKTKAIVQSSVHTPDVFALAFTTLQIKETAGQRGPVSLQIERVVYEHN